MGFRCRGGGGAHALVLLCVLLHGRKPMLWEAELTIAVASAVPMAAIIALALGCYIGLSVPGMLAVTFLFTALLTIYAVTVRALCLEYRKSGLAD